MTRALQRAILALPLLLLACHKHVSLAKLEARNAGPEFDRRYNVDGINDQSFDGNIPVVLDSGRATGWRIRGWAVDAAAKQPADGVVLVVDHARELQARYGVRRSDVAAALNQSEYAASGFELQLDKSELARGRHSLSLVILSADGGAYYRPRGEWTFEVR